MLLFSQENLQFSFLEGYYGYSSAMPKILAVMQVRTLLFK